MTAPMLVTNWINMQYCVSTVDNRLFGSGNKVPHDVVGGRLGVFEGNGGDLRIGLPIQSLHDGQRLQHMPLRLSVFIEASQRSIESVIEKNEVVRSLIHNHWIHLFQIAPQTRACARYRDGVGAGRAEQLRHTERRDPLRRSGSCEVDEGRLRARVDWQMCDGERQTMLHPPNSPRAGEKVLA